MARLPSLGLDDRSSTRPLYEQVAALLAGEIEKGTVRRGVPLPPERSVCEQMGISRVTLRRALSILAEQGLVVPSHGRGWFVNDSLLGELPNALQGLSEIAASRGLRVTSRVLLAHVREATLDEADELEIGPGAPLYELRRTRLLDDVPVAVDHARIPVEVCPELTETNFEEQSLYQTLDAHGVTPSRCDFAVQAVAANEEHALRLGVAVSTPLLFAAGTTFDRGNRPIELSRVHFVGERYRFRATLYRRPEMHRTHPNEEVVDDTAR